jgi:LAO/AO transport system kinase
VNKADKPGADDLVGQLQFMLEMKPTSDNGWRPPVLKTIAVKNQGIPELVGTFRRHRRFLIDTGTFSEHNFKREFQFFKRLVREMAAEKIFTCVAGSPIYLEIIEDLKNRKIDPFAAAEQLMERLEIGW